MSKRTRTVLLVLAVMTAAAAINFAPMLSLKMPGMQSQTVEGIQVYSLPRDADDARILANRIHDQSRRIVDALGSTDNGAFSVIVYPTQKALHRKTIGLAGYLLPAWFVGDNTRDAVLITSPSRPGPAHDRESVERAAVHEYVHLVTDRRNRRLGYWLKEGVALYLAGQTPSEADLRQAADIRWDEFSHPTALQFAEVGGYYLAYDLIEYLEGEYGWDSVVALTAPNASFERVLGKSEKEIFDEWTARI